VPAANPGDQPASAVVVTSPPHVIGDTEFFVHVGGRSEVGRRALKPGEHVAVDCPLVLAYPQHFRDSNEPPDTWVEGVLSEEALKRQAAEQMRLAAHNGRRITPCCLRCGASSERSVLLQDQPSELDLINALSGIEDSDWTERVRVERTFATLARAVTEQETALINAEAGWRTEHQQCPPGTPPMGEEPVPDNAPLQWRLPGVRSVG
jgi:hypothetical protein